MKGLEEWLASSSSSSSSSSESSSSSISSSEDKREIKQKEKEKEKEIKLTNIEVAPITDVKKRQAEMRERMRNLLGDGVVNAVVAKSSNNNSFNNNNNNNNNNIEGEKELLAASYHSNSTKKKHYHHGKRSSMVSSQTNTSDSDISNNNNKSRNKNKKRGHNNNNNSSNESKTHSHNSTKDNIEYRRVEIMVVDRGTQTTTTVACQTDPEPISTNNILYNALALHNCHCFAGNQRERHFAPLNAKEESELPNRFKEQLEMIQNSIEIMIARYNLPPPPLPRVQ